MKQPTILDCTLRDGSYAINFSFTAQDTTRICQALETAGITYIETGHGVGLRASEKGFGKAIATDEEYMIATKQGITNAKWGMFCIPGIAENQDIDLAAKHEMDFIRVGTNCTEVEQSQEFIKKAKDAGMMVCANYMKSYALTPNEFADKVKLSESYGADMVYVVDSAGGMFPHQLKEYVDAIKDVSNISIGFHGHDNLGYAVANSIEAARMGVSFVDTSLQGLGRSAGNASTEQVAACLHKLGMEAPDFLALFKAGKELVQPLVTDKGKNPLDMVSGYADFHSSYMPHILKAAGTYGVSPEKLIIEMTKIDRVDLDPEKLKEVATSLDKEPSTTSGYRYAGTEQDR